MSAGTRQAIVPMQRWLYRCLGSGKLFEVDDVMEYAEGVKAARTPSGRFVALVADADSVWDEVAEMWRAALSRRSLSLDTFEYNDAFNAALSAALDPTPDGECYTIRRRPPCPFGHTDEDDVILGRPAVPRNAFDRLVDLPEHTAWDAMTPEAKRTQVDAIVGDWLAHARERLERGDRVVARYNELKERGRLASKP